MKKQRRRTKYYRKTDKKQTPNEGVLHLLHLYELFDLLNNNAPSCAKEFPFKKEIKVRQNLTQKKTMSPNKNSAQNHNLSK